MALCRHGHRFGYDWLATLMGVVVGVVIAPPARADVATATPIHPTNEVALRWTAPVGCPDGGTVLGQVRSLATRDPDAPIDANAKVWVDEGGHWRVALVTESLGVRGERIIDADSCSLAADATAYVLATMVDPDAVRARFAAPSVDKVDAPPFTSAPDASIAAAPVATPVPTKESPPPPPAPAQERRFGLAALASVDSAVLPSAGVGFGGGLNARVFPWNDRPSPFHARVEASFRYFPAVHASSSIEPSRGADLRLAAGQTTLFASWDLGALSLGPSLALEVGALTGDGRGVSQPVHGESLWMAALPGAFARWPARGQLAARAQLEAAIPLGKSEFVLASETLHQSAPSARASIAADFRF